MILALLGVVVVVVVVLALLMTVVGLGAPAGHQRRCTPGVGAPAGHHLMNGLKSAS